MTGQRQGGSEARMGQMLPVLSQIQVEAARRFASGPPQHFAASEMVFATGDRDVPVWLVLDGSIDVLGRDGLDEEAPITTHGAGQFTGEVSQIDGRATIASARAGQNGATALPFDPPHLRALMIGSAEVGEILMRALILRRVRLIEQGSSGTILIGGPGDAHLLRLQGFLTRNGYPNRVMDPKVDGEGRSFVERMALLPIDLPLVVCPNGTLLKRPNEAELASCLGIVPEIDPQKVYDIAIIGAGPAGLAAAVYAASEGLSTIVLDDRAMGGQAGASARIENYLGFPTGISGQALAGRAFNQALKFGAEVAIPVGVERLERNGERLMLTLSGGTTLASRTVVIASGATYQRPDILGLSRLEGAGVSYWASPVEARLCKGKDVALVGGGNSAGQAIVFLASHVKRLHVFVRRGLSQTMSRYLIDRVSALPNVEVHVGTDLVELDCDGEALAGAIVRDRASGASVRFDINHLFLFIGATPHTRWLGGSVEMDDKGFILTGGVTTSLETSMPGVFAIGDVRAGSTKRVAAAVGDGAAAVAQIHSYLSRSTREAS
ncbi:MAG: cyclic nucleotide-binding domain-containing protein [Mesorhizobium sp.]|uniref:FAD-dependent oxidoreductase n=1 Tax=Mesorhizobium sp. TaxID=1871066 RepID=UPI0011F92710|nr:FAD-dependent oxidoreductase [Mesorhizobium sp.]TIO52140.1 MAG: cyclic nucleotide-binding domain-containing protein [Mesorhizobium sp.]TIO60804.1 MAG: cyclic nucleotide-binding domain-containing protein [Mesorhizobium sp.]TJV65350.1 MAG: cyclic nucleotide-binding domain-containing protein [Mesorhizobium sp.]